jgi:hypothetical protein
MDYEKDTRRTVYYLLRASHWSADQELFRLPSNREIMHELNPMPSAIIIISFLRHTRRREEHVMHVMP